MPLLRRARGFLIAVCLSACSSGGHGTSHPTLGSGAHPLDAVLHLNEIQVKGTHNSYHVEKPGNLVPDWMYTRDPLDVQLDQQGVRAVEIDTHMDDAIGAIRVYHVISIDEGSTCNLFSDCLRTIKSWSDAHPSHHALFVHIEPKDAGEGQTPNFDTYADLLDQTILSVWPRERVIAPADVQGSAATLREAVTTKGWPTLGETRGKVLFYLNERDKFHAAYTRGGSDISGRIAFPESHVDEPIGGVVILNDPTQDPILAAVQQGFLVRTTCDGVPRPPDTVARREQSLASGAHIISTDFPVAADGGDSGFWIPGGTPSRCNPINGPSNCTSEAVEDPATLTRSP
jgi:hypothetical protein